MEKQEEIPKEHDDKSLISWMSLLEMRQDQDSQVLDIVESHGGRMYSENNPDSEGDAYN